MPARNHRRRAGRARRARPHAHRRRQVHHLPGARHDSPRPHHRRHAPRVAHEGPGRQPHGPRHTRRLHQRRTPPLAGAPRLRPLRHGQGAHPLRLARTPLRRVVHGRGTHLEHLPHRCRRGTLHLPVGLRLPPLLPAHPPAPRHRRPRRPRPRRHRLRHPSRRRRHTRPARLPPRQHHPHPQLRPLQPLLHRPPRQVQVRQSPQRPPEHLRFG